MLWLASAAAAGSAVPARGAETQMNEVSPQTQHRSWNDTSPLLAKNTLSAEPCTTSGKESFNLAASNALFLISEPFSLQLSESCAIVVVQEGLLFAYSYMAPAERTCKLLMLLC